MRLVGASTLYIALPFLLEALVTALIGVALAGARWRRSCTSASSRGLEHFVGFIPWVGCDEFLNALAVVAILGRCSRWSRHSC